MDTPDNIRAKWLLNRAMRQDLSEEEKLLKDFVYLKLIHNMVNRFDWRGFGIPREEAVQEAGKALIIAHRVWDREGPFKSLAAKAIQNALIDLLRKDTSVSAVPRRSRAFTESIHNLEPEYSNTGLDADEFTDALDQRTELRMVHLAELRRPQLPMLVPEILLAEDQLSNGQVKEMFRVYLREITRYMTREQRTKFKWLMFHSDPFTTFEDMASELGIPIQRARKIESTARLITEKAIEKLMEEAGARNVLRAWNWNINSGRGSRSWQGNALRQLEQRTISKLLRGKRKGRK